jgi:hypothetical protein
MNGTGPTLTLLALSISGAIFQIGNFRTIDVFGFMDGDQIHLSRINKEASFDRVRHPFVSVCNPEHSGLHFRIAN